MTGPQLHSGHSTEGCRCRSSMEGRIEKKSSVPAERRDTSVPTKGQDRRNRVIPDPEYPRLWCDHGLRWVQGFGLWVNDGPVD